MIIREEAELRTRIAADVRDAVLLDEAYEGERLPPRVAAAFDICVRRIENARRMLERALIERSHYDDDR